MIKWVQFYQNVLFHAKMKQINALPIDPSLNTNPNETQLGQGTTKIAANIFLFFTIGSTLCTAAHVYKYPF